MSADALVTHAVDGERGTWKVDLELTAVEPKQTDPEAAKKAIESLPPGVTFHASPEQAEKMRAEAAEVAGKKQERREAMVSFRAWAAGHSDRWLTQKDFDGPGTGFFAHLPLPYVGDGICEISRHGDRWRFVLADGTPETGPKSIRDVIELGDDSE